MASVKYTSDTIVNDRIQGAGTSLSSAEINEIIVQCEGYLDTMMKLPSTFSFSQSKSAHLTIRKAATDMAALYVLAATPMSWQTLNQVALASDILRDSLMGSLKLLADQDYVNYIKNA